MKSLTIYKSTIAFLIVIMFSCVYLSVATAQEERPDVAQSSNQVSPILIGQKMPEVALKNAKGKRVTLSSLATDKPAVIVFYRGGWCPYCNRQLSGLADIKQDIEEIGYRLVGVCMDQPSILKKYKSANHIKFPIYSDHTAEAVTALGIGYKVSDETVQKYLQNGIDLEKASGEDHHILPVPTVLLVDKSGKVLFKYANPDYRVRLEKDVLLAAAEAYYPSGD